MDRKAAENERRASMMRPTNSVDRGNKLPANFIESTVAPVSEGVQMNTPAPQVWFDDSTREVPRPEKESSREVVSPRRTSQRNRTPRTVSNIGSDNNKS